MRKLRVFESISIDGYFSDANGNMNWAHAGREDAEFADWVGGNASNTHLLKGDLATAVRELKSSDGPGITVLGSGSVTTELGEAGLVDEYQFVIIPVALGSGRAVFTKGCKLRLIDQRAFHCGNVAVTYST
jgi:dihydrofolate reductase